MKERPIRIQLSRRKGWRMPENTVKVDRTTKWGNPFVVHSDRGPSGKRFEMDPTTAVWLFRKHIEENGSWSPIPVHRWPKGKIPKQWTSVDDVQRELRGKNLACWCALPAPGEPDICHAAVLLELANKE